MNTADDPLLDLARRLRNAATRWAMEADQAEKRGQPFGAQLDRHNRCKADALAVERALRELSDLRAEHAAVQK